MKKKKLESIFLSGMLLFQSFVHCQEINIGDALKESDLISTGISAARPKGKWILLDFWSHTCISCIQSFPKLDSLQKEYDDRLQIILVNKESADSTNRFFEKRKKITRPSVTFFCGDTVLAKRLPHTAVPYHAWLDSNLIVRYLTYGENITREKINSVLAGETKNLISYKNVQQVSSLFDSSWLKSLKYFSYISVCNPAFQLQAEKLNGFEQVSFNCFSVLDLYIEAFKIKNKYPYHKPGRTVLEVSDPSPYQKPQHKEALENWYTSYAHNYHLLIPASQKSSIYCIMQADLQRYFPLRASIEKRKVKCLVLKRTSTINKLATKGGKSVNNFYYADESFTKIEPVRYMRNQAYDVFSRAFQNYVEFHLQTHFIDQAELSGNVDIGFEGTAIDSKNILQIRSELRKYDLALEEEDVIMDVLVLTEKK